MVNLLTMYRIGSCVENRINIQIGSREGRFKIQEMYCHIDNNTYKLKSYLQVPKLGKKHKKKGKTKPKSADLKTETIYRCAKLCTGVQ